MKKTNKRDQRKILREIRDTYKGTKCIDCKGDFSKYVMTLDHRNPKRKKADIGELISRAASEKDFRSELKKTDPVCRNCHAIREHKRKS